MRKKASGRFNYAGASLIHKANRRSFRGVLRVETHHTIASGRHSKRSRSRERPETSERVSNSVSEFEVKIYAETKKRHFMNTVMIHATVPCYILTLNSSTTCM